MSGPAAILATIQIRRLCARPFTPYESFSRIRHAETGREQLLLRYRKKIDPTAAVEPHKKKTASEARAKELYLELQAKSGGHIGLNAYYDMAKLDGVTRKQAQAIHREMDPTAHDLGRKKGPSK